mmetsp:Transcript_111277/g.321760  ORF Transcript_111277/g.321760 Transcript_111277/m.321760 type:complete len:275 (-) Transcript_111277:639-1463(-)
MPAPTAEGHRNPRRCTTPRRGALACGVRLRAAPSQRRGLAGALAPGKALGTAPGRAPGTATRLRGLGPLPRGCPDGVPSTPGRSSARRTRTTRSTPTRTSVRRSTSVAAAVAAAWARKALHRRPRCRAWTASGAAAPLPRCCTIPEPKPSSSKAGWRADCVSRAALPATMPRPTSTTEWRLRRQPAAARVSDGRGAARGRRTASTAAARSPSTSQGVAAAAMVGRGRALHYPRHTRASRRQGCSTMPRLTASTTSPLRAPCSTRALAMVGKRPG